MRALVFAGPGEVSVEEVPTPTAGPGELLLDVGANTVCGTDVRIIRGEKTAGIDRGVVLGHEVAGRIADVGEGVSGYAVGDLVGLAPVVTCGTCHACTRGMEQVCPNASIVGYRIDGGLAERMVVPAHAVARGNVVRAPREVPVEHLSLAEPLSCCLSAHRTYRVELGDTVVILGAGPIGLIHTQLALRAGARRVIVSDPAAQRRAIAESFGATTVDPTTVDLGDHVRDATDGIGADVAVVCIGMPGLLADALGIVRLGGRVNAFAGFPSGATAEIDPNLIHYRELTVTGAANSRRSDYRDAVQLIADGAIDVGRLVTHRFPLDQAVEAIEASASGDGIKVAVMPTL